MYHGLGINGFTQHLSNIIDQHGKSQASVDYQFLKGFSLADQLLETFITGLSSSSLTGRDEEGDPGDDDEHARGKVVGDDVVRDLALQRQLKARHRKST